MILEVGSRLEMGFFLFDWIRDLLGWILNLIYSLLSTIGIQNAAVCIIVFTILIKLLMMTTFYQQQKSQKLMSVVQPELKKITEKYKNKKDQASMTKQQMETQAVYDKYGINPASGCLSTLVTMLVIFALYQVIYNLHEYITPINELLTDIAKAIKDSGVNNYTEVLEKFAKKAELTQVYKGSNKTEDIVNLLNNIKPNQWDDLQKLFASSKECTEVITTNSAKLVDIHNVAFGLNFRQAPTDKLIPGVLIPILALVTQLYSIHQMTKKQKTQQDMNDNPMMQSMMTMNKIMPLFSFFICLSMPIGIGIYWILGSVVQIIQTFFFDRHFAKMDVDKLVKENIEKASKKKASGKKSYMQKLMDAQQDLEEKNEKSIKDYAHIKSKNYSENNDSDDIDNGSEENKTYKSGSISSYANILKSEKGK